MPHLQQLYQQYRSKGLVVLGLNSGSGNDRAAALHLLREHGVTFPNVLDGSEAARKVETEAYRASSGVPLNYLVDREGIIIDAWCGSPDEAGARRALEQLGIGTDEKEL